MPMRVPQRAEMAQEAPLLGGVEVFQTAWFKGRIESSTGRQSILCALA